MGRAREKTGTMSKALAVGAKAGAAALLGLGFAAKVGFDELSQHQKVAAQTAAVLKSTGGAAGVTAGHVSDLSGKLLQMSGVDDEAIQSMENMLLTFRNIHNEAGRTNDVFDQATKATLDMSVAMGKDLNSSAILVGKALNDPVKGLTALRRVGVQFTSDQENLIKHLVATGNTMEAQKLILGELNQEFGGSAKAAGSTLPGQLSILRENFKNLAADIVSALLPSIQTLVGGLSGVVGWMQRNKTATKVLVVSIAALSTGLIIANAVIKAWAVVTKVAAAAQWLLNAALAANPVALVVIAIVALAAAFVVAWKRSATFRAIVTGALHAVQSVVKAVLGIWKSEWDLAASAVSHVIGYVKSLIGYVQSLIGWISKIHLPSLPGSGSGSTVPSRGGGGGGGSNPTFTVSRGGAGVEHIHIHIDGREVASLLRDRQRSYGRANSGKLLFTP